MRLISTLIKNSIKLDYKMLIPFFATIVVIVLMTSASSVSNELFIGESREPAIQKYGGEVCVYKSSQSAEFAMVEEGLYEKWYRQLFDPASIEIEAPTECITYDLSIWGKHSILFQMDTELIGRAASAYTPEWEIFAGSVPQITDYQEWYSSGKPIVFLVNDKMPLEIREFIKVGYEFYAYVPNVIDSGGKLNLKGMSNTVILPDDAISMDYLDYKNGQWTHMTVAAIGRLGLGTVDDSAIVMPLAFLQELTGAGNKINNIGISMPDNSESEMLALANSITKEQEGFYGLRTTDMFISTFKSVRDLEKHADMLMYAAYLIGTLMVTCVLILMLRNRRASDVQLMTLGINRGILAIVVLVEIVVISAASVIIGFLIPAITSLIQSGAISINFTELGRLFLIVPFNLLITLIVSQIMLPNSKQCLEVLRNE